MDTLLNLSKCNSKNNLNIRRHNFRALQSQYKSIEPRDILSPLHCNLIMNLLTNIQSIANDSVHSEIKELSIITHFKIKQLTRSSYYPLVQLLEFYGDAEDMIQNYEDDILAAAHTYNAIGPGQLLAIEAPSNYNSLEAHRRIKSNTKISMRASASKESTNRSVMSIIEQPYSPVQALHARDKISSCNGSKLRLKRDMLVPYISHYTEDEVSRKAMVELEKIRRKRLEREFIVFAL